MFEPTRQAALERLAAVDPDAYARTRNALDGAVTRLSPYLTHGLLGLRETYEAVHARHALPVGHRFVMELGWRAYWRHVWAHLGEGIHQSLRPGPLPDDAYSHTMPADVLRADTGIPVIDQAVRALHGTGYLHNHARMWLASYLVHLRKVHWHTGAQWMLGHLLDGDLASNHLSWQWIAGTASHKPYLFNADNVARFAPSPWHSPGTVIDTSYEALDAVARQPVPAGSLAARPEDAAHGAPALEARPAAGTWTAPSADLVRGKDVYLLHPWRVQPTAEARGAAAIVVGVGLPAAHADRPWSARRWDFVTRALRVHTPHLWWADAGPLAQALSAARSVHWQPEPHVDAFLPRLPHVNCHVEEEPALFAPVPTFCNSFSRWWRLTRLLA